MKFFIFILLSLLLTACGGSSSSTIVNVNPPIISDLGSTKVIVELGRVASASVKLFTNNQELAVFQTDAKGEYTLKRSSIKSSIDGFGMKNTDYIYIVSTGGTDIDPNDDGVTTDGEAISVQGSVKGLISVQDFMAEGEVRINLISTAIVNIIGRDNFSEINEEVLARVAKEIGVSDINKDGHITNKDVYQYDMVTHVSRAENLLKYNGFDSYIHDGDLALQSKTIDTIKSNINTGIYKTKTTNKTSVVSLFTLDSTREIQFAKNKKSKNGSPYHGEEISLEADQFIAYRECKKNDSDKCKEEQVIYFTGTEILDYYPEPSSNDSVSKTEIAEMQGNLIARLKSLKSSLQAIEDNNLSIEEAQKEKEKLQAQLDEINEELGSN